MILQSLYQLYERLRQEKNYRIAPPGYSLQKIVFRVVLHPDGKLHAIEDARIKGNHGRLLPHQLQVPGSSHQPGSGFSPLFLWDKPDYMLGYKNDDVNPDRTTGAFKSFRERHLARRDEIRSDSYQAVCNFLELWQLVQASDWPVLQEVGPGYGVFQIIGQTGFVHEDPVVQDWWSNSYSEDEESHKGQCLITGDLAPIARLQHKIKKVGSQGESQIVSFNDSAFESYGKSQSFNAPISEAAAFRYATALNALLDGPMNYKHRFILGDATVVFWTEKPTNTEDIFAIFAEGKFDLSNQEKAQDESIRQKIQLFLKALRRGKKVYPELDRDPDRTKFYLLGLTGQAKGRIGVRFFYWDNLSKLLDNLRRHYSDISVVRQFDSSSRYPDPEFPTLQQILDETTPRRQNKPDRKKIPPVLEAPLLKAVIAGTLYPMGLYLAIVRRIHADRQVNYVRACIIAGYLRRNLKQEVSMCLDRERKEPSYRLGRLFAVLEKVQGEALGKINAGIRDRFYSSASATPGIAFPRILRTYQHHLGKLPEGLRINRERLVQEILAPVKDFPSHLDLAEQGMFALGYYHQSKELWTAKTEKSNPEGGKE
ncbi:MAG: type I-C CRISPR-associated protein Cas8c/Csd1 [Candidatus Erginobacter occultus]|nr:type I-C CRISPR-associated protein Cas8c/Csd1 [Candidatus Erginobacter occultus]